MQINTVREAPGFAVARHICVFIDGYKIVNHIVSTKQQALVPNQWLPVSGVPRRRCHHIWTIWMWGLRGRACSAALADAGSVPHGLA